jgi:signal transduction histidine kinase
MNIRQKLIIILLFIALVPTLIISTVAYVSISNAITRTTVDQLASIAIKQQQRINTFLQKRNEDALRVTIQYDLQKALEQYFISGDKASLEEVDKILSSNKLGSQYINSIYVVDIKGLVLATTVLGSQGQTLKPEYYFVEPEQQTTASLKEDPKDGIDKLYVTTKVTISKKMVGTLVMIYRLDEIVSTVEDYTGLGASGETVIAKQDKDKNAISLFSLRFDQNAAFTTKLNSLDLFTSGDNVFMDKVDYRGKEVIVATKHIEGPGWAMATKIDTSEAFAPIVALRNILIIIVITSSLIIILAAYYFAKFFTSPITALTDKARLISQGDLTQRIDISSSDEIGTLASTFNTMTSKLQELYEGLEQKVREKTAELAQKLQESEQDKAKIDEQRSILFYTLENLPIGISLAKAPSGEISLINRAGAALLGSMKRASTDNGPGSPYPFFKSDDTLYPPAETPFAITLREKKVSMRDDITSHPFNGSKITLRATSAPILNGEGQVYLIVTVLEDVTREKEVDRMKTEFISLASHQLRTPLSAIKWFTEMLLSGDAGQLTAEQSDFAKNVADSTERMIELVNSLLNISRIESGRIIIDPKPTDLAKLVNGIVTDLKGKTEEKQQTLIVSVHKDLPMINLDPQLIGQVYLNLLTNAIKYTPKGGEITVFVSRKDNELVSQVSDNGYGIPLTQQSRVFQKFFRADNVIKVITDGTGLGLYLIKSIVESSKGRIWFESHTKEENLPDGRTGTTFFFSLPITGMIAKKGEVSLGS